MDESGNGFDDGIPVELDVRVEKNDNAPAGTTRREFLTLALVTGSGMALVGVPRPLLAGGGDVPTCATETLLKIGQIGSSGGKLKGVLKIKNGPKVLPGYGGGQMPMMRYFEGYDQQMTGAPVWPPTKTALLPGPTLRVAVGERVELTFLNQTDVGAFPGGSLDRAEAGLGTGCDQATNATPTSGTADGSPDKDWYPGTRGDTYPNCFHASSSANLHFHGTHVTPDGFGDNVLITVRPDPSITEEKVRQIFEAVFAECAKHDGAPPWSSLPPDFVNWQAKTVNDADLNAIWQGTRGPVNGATVLPEKSQLVRANQVARDHGLWPQFFIGAYPSCFKVTEAAGHKMGQAPGTHWYHAHKHGSTSINLFNGLAGALIIEGDYDRDLEKIYPGLKQTEKVLVVQVFTDLPNLERPPGGGTSATTTNGTQVVRGKAKTDTQPPQPGVNQQAPTIVMRPGEIQLWRIINAQVQNRLAGTKFSGPALAPVSPLPKFRQIAQDGVQFNYVNYRDQPLTMKDSEGNGTQFTLGAGGRIDILVQAPQIAAGSTENYELAGIVNLTVCGDPANDQFPVKANYPVFPSFLHPVVGPFDNTRTLNFGWEPYRIKNGPATNASAPNVTPVVRATHAQNLPFTTRVGNPKIGYTPLEVYKNRGPYWTIDDEQFSDDKYYQTIELDAHEEWKILNTTNVPHPFHIHVNPFYVIEVYDPNNSANSWTRDKGEGEEGQGVWHDNIVVPGAKNDDKNNMLVDKDGKATTPGFVRFRSRFVDFPGKFVLHCHILAHEDRGMMQLVQVIDVSTTIRHH